MTTAVTWVSVTMGLVVLIWIAMAVRETREAKKDEADAEREFARRCWEKGRSEYERWTAWGVCSWGSPWGSEEIGGSARVAGRAVYFTRKEPFCLKF